MEIRSLWLIGVAVVCGAKVGAAEPRPLPTVPQIPPLSLTAEPPPRGMASPYTTRIHVPLGERRTSALREQSEAAPPPSANDSLMSPHVVGRSFPSGVRSLIPGSPIKAWLFFHPTTGKALPCFQPQPYVGPVSGTFGCTAATAWSDGVSGYPRGCCGSQGPLHQSPGHPNGSGLSAKPPAVLPEVSLSPSGYRYAQPEHPKLFEQLLLPSQPSSSPSYSPPQKGFWNTPVRRISAVPSPLPQ
jgi:hypothetical protein